MTPNALKTRQIRKFGGHIFVHIFALYVGGGGCRQNPHNCFGEFSEVWTSMILARTSRTRRVVDHRPLSLGLFRGAVFRHGGGV